MNEMSFESLMAVGTGLASPESKESKINGVPFDGYNDGVDMDLARTSEQLHFVDTYDKLQSLHSAEKLKMIKKISTAYNVKTIGNANVANSVESFCNNAMSTEDIKEVAAKVKAKFIEIFKKIVEFFKNLITKVMSARYKGTAADKIKTLLKTVHDTTNDLIKQISTAGSDKDLSAELNAKQKKLNEIRKALMEMLSCYNLAAKLAKAKYNADKKATVDNIIDTDALNNNVPELKAARTYFESAQSVITSIVTSTAFKTIKADGQASEPTEDQKKLEELDKNILQIRAAKEKMEKLLKGEAVAENKPEAEHIADGKKGKTKSDVQGAAKSHRANKAKEAQELANSDPSIRALRAKQYVDSAASLVW